ncbi:MAG: hypothetical protein ACREIS_09530 [Nitrospiraceae bacterium]
MGRMLLSLFFGLVIILAMTSASIAHQAGGAEIGDLETGSVIGQPFKGLPVDLSFQAIELAGGQKLWYPPTAVLSVRDRTNPVVLKVTNGTAVEHGFYLSADATFSAPTSLTVKIVLKPGEIKYIGIPSSDLTYTTAGNLFVYKCHLHEAHLGGQLLVLK